MNFIKKIDDDKIFYQNDRFSYQIKVLQLKVV